MLFFRLRQLEDQRDHNRVARDDMLLDMDIRLDTLEERLSGLNVEEVKFKKISKILFLLS